MDEYGHYPTSLTCLEEKITGYHAKSSIVDLKGIQKVEVYKVLLPGEEVKNAGSVQNTKVMEEIQRKRVRLEINRRETRESQY